MKLHQDIRPGRNIVTAYGESYVDINGRRYDNAFVVTPERVVEQWGAGSFEALTEADFANLAELGAEILLLGTGLRQRFPRPQLLRALIERRIGIEVMDTQAACRTYNILVGEDRVVAAALLIG
jgi:uncharacterized protein